jgi:hypothetical protein
MMLRPNRLVRGRSPCAHFSRSHNPHIGITSAKLSCAPHRLRRRTPAVK